MHVFVSFGSRILAQGSRMIVDLLRWGACRPCSCVRVSGKQEPAESDACFVMVILFFGVLRVSLAPHRSPSAARSADYGPAARAVSQSVAVARPGPAAFVLQPFFRCLIACPGILTPRDRKQGCREKIKTIIIHHY